MQEKIKNLLLKADKPTRYTGGEYNAPETDKPCKVRFLLAYADVYEVGMSNLGYAILYDLLNKEEDVVCERVFTPRADFGALLKENNVPLFSIETFKALSEFDIIGFSVPYELSYTNILYMLDLAKIPFRASDRNDNFPLIIGGGPSSANPEPIIDFFDAFCIGEGEDAILKIAQAAKNFKGDKQKILDELAKIEGVYVPQKTPRVKKTSAKNFETYAVTKPLVPNVEVVHDRSVVELFRGCYSGCRFCQACFFYRPIRIKSAKRVICTAEKLVDSTGFEEIGLTSLSSGDYPHIKEVISGLKKLSEEKHVTFQMPSLRLDSFSDVMANTGRKSLLTFAPEAGSQRLRDVINKNITDLDIEKSMRVAFSNGYNSVKLYFMLGLPTETDEDILGIVTIVEKIRRLYIEIARRKDLNITVSTSMFIPKPATPFQWAAQISEAEMDRRVNILKRAFYPMKGIKYAYHGSDTSVLEGMLARGDKKLSYVIEKAYENGAFFDSWSEGFKPDAWKKALKDCGVAVEDYTRGISENEELPWDFIEFPTAKKYFLREYKKALSGETTPSCKGECQGCGAKC